jgi:putative ABC transport system permease protein
MERSRDRSPLVADFQLPPLNKGERFYRALLKLYPTQFREAFALDLVEAFRDERRAADRNGTSSIAFWFTTVHDVLTQACSERFASVWRMSEHAHQLLTLRLMTFHDLRIAARTLRNNPLFALTAIVTIGLGIGSSTAIFSVVNAVLLQPLPYAHPDRLAIVETDLLTRHVVNFPMAFGNVPDLKARVTAFQDVALIGVGTSAFVGSDGKAEQVNRAGVTSNFFSLLGTHIALGRNFGDADGAPLSRVAADSDQQAVPTPTGPLVSMAILSHEFWERQFGGSSAVIGTTVQLGAGRAMIVGVAAPDARPIFLTDVAYPVPDVFIALRIDWSTASRTAIGSRAIARLAPGATFAAAQSQISAFGAELQRRYPLYKGANAVWRVEPMQANIVHDVRPAILALMGAVIFVLLIACANVANLLLVRALARERELAIRAALGGTRATLIGQMFGESVLLAGCGAALGLVLAKLGVAVLLRIAPANLPRVSNVAIDPLVLVFAVVAAFLSAIVFGVLPAVRASRPDLAQTLRAAGRSPSLGGGKFLRQAVVLLEVALSFVLLIGSGLMLRSFVALERLDPGFDANGVLTFTTTNTRLRTADERAGYTQTLQEHLRAIPGVVAVTAGNILPLDGADVTDRWASADAANDPTRYQQATLHVIRPDYFTAMKARLIAGRSFTEAEDNGNSRAIIIDDMLAAKAFPGQSPQSVVGKQIYSSFANDGLYEIIGVAQHERDLSLTAPGREEVFVVDGLAGFMVRMRWAVRTTGDATRLIPAVRATVAEIDPLVPLGDVKPMSDYVDQAMASTRFSLVLLATFAVIAALLAAVGLYGVLATAVRQRTAEIGVRMAFGATSANIFRLIVGQGLALSAAGIVAGLVVAFALTGVLAHAGMLVSIAPTDPLTYAGVSVLFVAIAALACWLPARRAARLAPNAALRSE